MLMDAKKELNVPIYVGMGDQDYARNVPICDNSNCSTRMAGYMAMDLIQKVQCKVIHDHSTIMSPGIIHVCLQLEIYE
uniref:Uncharacterized protein n=1 Tax=Romanomermis culicivorax TaxID=13658 RepID=A0A915L5D2_ROMCU